jgi:hypothetical protein
LSGPDSSTGAEIAFIPVGVNATTLAIETRHAFDAVVKRCFLIRHRWHLSLGVCPIAHTQGYWELVFGLFFGCGKPGFLKAFAKPRYFKVPEKQSAL